MKRAAHLTERTCADGALSFKLMALMCAVFGLLALTLQASPPAWWSSRGVTVPIQITTNSGVVTTNYIPNDYVAVNESQLKQFTARAVDELNANLSGGAGTNLNSLVLGWHQDYSTNSYTATNPKPLDLQAIRVGQLKYIANKVYSPLIGAGYMAGNPSWLRTNSVVDSNIANIGQLKQAFNFEITVPQMPLNLTAISGSTQSTLSWVDPILSVQTYTLQASTDGGTTWSTIATVAGNINSVIVTGQILGTNYIYRVTANNPSGSSSPSTNDVPPTISLLTPSGATLVP